MSWEQVLWKCPDHTATPLERRRWELPNAAACLGGTEKATMLKVVWVNSGHSIAGAIANHTSLVKIGNMHVPCVIILIPYSLASLSL